MIKKITNPTELYALLKEKYDSRFICSMTQLNNGNIEGFLDEKLVNIAFDAGNYLLISIEESGEYLLQNLIPILKEVMEDENPICSYDFQNNDLVNYTNIEWNLKIPEKRLTQIINGHAFTENTRISNLILYNNKNIEDYIEEKIYGIYPGYLTSTTIEIVNNMSEIELFIFIEAFIMALDSVKYDMTYGKIPKRDLTEYEYALEYLIYQTRRFGVILPVTKTNEHIIDSPAFNAWFNFYNNYFNYIITDKEWNDFNEAIKNQLDLEPFKPKGDWRNLLKSRRKRKKQ